MIRLNKMHDEPFLINHNQIEYIESIPETKIVMMNHDFYIVKDTVDEIVEKIAQYEAKVADIHRHVSIVDKRSDSSKK